MSLQDHVHHDGGYRGRSLTSPMVLVLLGFIVIGGALLFTEHRAHVLGALIYLPLLLCPLMHLFMHRGHGGHGHHGSGSKPNRERNAP
jgi:hypothetical protein